MKKHIVATILILFAAVSVRAQTGSSEERRQIRKENNEVWQAQAKYAFGIHTGLDIGGAVPFGGMSGMKMRAVPRLRPQLGVSFTSYPIHRLTATVEVTYKQVGIDAEAWVSGQQFTLPGDPPATTMFRGTADVSMQFSMLEIPVYAGYSFEDGRNKVFFGGYYSRIFKARFNTTPLKGMVENPNDSSAPPVLVTPDNPVPSDVMPAFNSYLGNWDAGLLAGYQLQIFPRIDLSARFSMGLKDIFKRGNNYLEYKMLHLRGSLTLSYSFLRYTK
ncbi:MAG: PorT family protein [Bacteroidales bacterium]|jgi:hypothetical protein|nr:PorT family protein [Bacteroidales bacterium]